MSSSATLPSPKLQRSGDLVVITFSGARIPGVENMIAGELAERAEGFEDCQLLLDFSNVKYLCSMELGTLINLHKKVRSAGGRLTLFNLNPHVSDVFSLSRLDTFLDICREEGGGSVPH